MKTQALKKSFKRSRIWKTSTRISKALVWNQLLCFYQEEYIPFWDFVKWVGLNWVKQIDGGLLLSVFGGFFPCFCCFLLSTLECGKRPDELQREKATKDRHKLKWVQKTSTWNPKTISIHGREKSRSKKRQIQGRVLPVNTCMCSVIINCWKKRRITFSKKNRFPEILCFQFLDRFLSLYQPFNRLNIVSILLDCPPPTS